MADAFRPLPPLVETAYVGQKLIFRRRKEWFRTNLGAAARVPGVSYFCPWCNEIWARRLIECSEPNHPEIGNKLLPNVENRACERHWELTHDRDLLSRAGSIVYSDVEWEQILHPESPASLEFLAYELFLIVRRYP